MKKAKKALLITAALLAYTTLMILAAEAQTARGDNATAVSNVGPTVNSTASSDPSATANAAPVTVNENAGNIPHQAPWISAPDATSTSSCKVAYSGGGSFLTGAAVLGFSRTDSECEKREAALAFEKIGDNQDALYILCTLKVAKLLPNCVLAGFDPKAAARKAKVVDKKK